MNAKNGIITYIKIKEDLALINIAGRRGGGIALMYKSENEWKEIYQGNGNISCSDLTQKLVPKKFWVDCWDENDNYVKGNVSLDFEKF